ncbi:hypothetical protein ACN9M1_06730 [Ralstonia sp. R-29]|uniref:hypothetical protein n=1 Tax=Ralstonia sp. R-29 TaxID=3404059 RepID=UPI003CF1C6D0
MARRQWQNKVVGIERPHVKKESQRNKIGNRTHPNLRCRSEFFETNLPPAGLCIRRHAPEARIFLPQKITPNGSSRNSYARKISGFRFLCDAQRMLDTGLTFNNNEIVAMHHP